MYNKPQNGLSPEIELIETSTVTHEGKIYINICMEVNDDNISQSVCIDPVNSTITADKKYYHHALRNPCSGSLHNEPSVILMLESDHGAGYVETAVVGMEGVNTDEWKLILTYSPKYDREFDTVQSMVDFIESEPVIGEDGKPNKIKVELLSFYDEDFLIGQGFNHLCM